MVSGQKGIAALILALGGLSWGFGYLGQPHLVIRYMAIRSSEEVALARKIAICWAIPGIIGAFFIGVIAMMYFGPAYFQTVDPEQSMPILASELLHPVVAGLFISGAVAAMMSTADSQLLVSASAITEDFFHQFLNKDISDKNLVKLSRFMIIILGIIAYCIALYSEIKGKNIFGLPKNKMVFQAGTSIDRGSLKTSGGRVMAITSFGDNFKTALKESYKIVEKIEYDGKYYRKDIGFDL